MGKFKLSRYEQHIDLLGVGIEGQEKINAARVLIVGVGGLGCPIAVYLTAAGIGTIGLIDADTVEESNLQRQILHYNSNINEYKVLSAKSKLDQLTDNQNIKIYKEFLDSENASSIIKEYDLVIDASDNHIVRLLINHICMEQGKPWVYGALYHFEGQYMSFNTNKTMPCFKCVFPQLDESTSLPTCKSAGVLSSIPGVIGSIQATEALKIIIGLTKEDDYNKLNLLNLERNSLQSMSIKKRHNCEVCGALNGK